MQEGKIVFRLLVPAHQNAPKAVQPAMTAFHHAATAFLASLLRQFLGLVTATTEMGGKAELLKDEPHLVIVVALVQAHSLRLLNCWFGPFDHDAFQGRPNQLHIVAIRAIKRQSDWYAVSLGQQ